MVFNIVIKPLAVLDIDDAIEWYEKKSKGLGKRFFLSFEDAMNRLSIDPTAYFSVTKDVRRMNSLKKFSIQNILYIVCKYGFYSWSITRQKKQSLCKKKNQVKYEQL